MANTQEEKPYTEADKWDGHRLTRQGMLRVITQEGGAVLHAGRIILNPAHLPGEDELARGNPVAEAAAAASLDFQIADLINRRNALLAANKQPGQQLTPLIAGHDETITLSSGATVNASGGEVSPPSSNTETDPPKGEDEDESPPTPTNSRNRSGSTSS